MTVGDVWTEAQLMGIAEGEAPVLDKGKGVAEDAMKWGVPGHLTKAECDVYFRFKAELEKRGQDVKDTVYSFGEEEGEAWCLTRWLRARKFVFEDVVKMIQDATEVRKQAKGEDFYPDPKAALGVDTALYVANYPQLYTGMAKNGVPLYISKPGVLNVDAIECITTLDGIVKYHWHVMMHDFANRLRQHKEKVPTFTRFECLCVLDLQGLTTAQLTSRALAIIKEQSAIDSVCFPETMHKMLILNSPTFFSATWRIIKGWLDPRTANKIEVISNTAAGQKRLLELVDAELLPSDYGGKAKDTVTTMDESGPGLADKVTTKMMYIRGHSSETIDVPAGEEVEIQVFTRSQAGGKFHITNADTKFDLAPIVEVKHTGTGDETERPTHVTISKDRIKGPLKIKIKGDSNAGRFARQNFLVVFFHFRK